MQDFFSRIFLRLENRHVRPLSLLRRAVTRLHYRPQKDANKTTAEIKVGRNDAPLREFGRACGLERLFWLKRGVRYQPIRNNKIRSCSLRKSRRKGASDSHISRARGSLWSRISNENVAEPSVSEIRARFDAPPSCVAGKIHAGKMGVKLSVTHCAGDVTRPGVGHHNRVGAPLARNGRFVSHGNDTNRKIRGRPACVGSNFLLTCEWRFSNSAAQSSFSGSDDGLSVSVPGGGHCNDIGVVADLRVVIGSHAVIIGLVLP